MKITFLGHAGFCVETANAVIIMDPWLSKSGAFDAAWFQYPQNHHLATFVRETLDKTKKDKYIYISHEHKDHFDLDFLTSLTKRDFTIILADFYHNVVKADLEKNEYQCKRIISLQDEKSLAFKDGAITLFIVDMELDADSAILIQSNTGTFLNLNDSKPHDRLTNIAQKYGQIDVFAGQFSGAIWHPTCYKMKPKEYEAVCKSKNKNKFETLARSLEILQPAFFLPSAGPPCFLDPQLFDIQLQKINTSPRARQLISFLEQRFSDHSLVTQWPEIMPGDVLDVPQRKFIKLAEKRVDDTQFLPYIKAYAEQYTAFFQERQRENLRVDPKQVFLDLKQELEEKLKRMHLVHKLIPNKLYFALDEYPEKIYSIDFQYLKITTTSCIKDTFFSISAPAWQIKKVLDQQISWADFALTFRVTLQRIPDNYNALSHAFLTLNQDRLEHFCQLYHDILFKKNRIKIESDGKNYSILRYCPHQGGDLLYSRIENGLLICPRHSWKFDLRNGGRCIHNNTSIEAICKDKNVKDDK